MELHQYYKEFVLVILCMYVHHTFSFDYDDDIETTVWTRCSTSIRNKLKNGRVKIRSRGRIAKFMCDPGFELVGKRFATCVRNQWNNPLPVCVARGCYKMQEPLNGRMTEMYRGALLTFDCHPGYVLDGANTLYCDGRRWSLKAPLCRVATTDPKMSCDFEDPDLCGWTHDPTHDFDWKRNQFSTPSGHVGTGPSYDHTFGKGKGGFYLYEEASSPRKENDKSRIFSPVFPPQYSGGCFIFWYHMYGATTGGLLVYVKPESHVFDELAPTWQKVGDQGNQWIRGNITVPSLGENFQIIIEGVRGSSYVGDSAIDDVSLSPTDCESMYANNATDVLEEPVTDSCRGRCREEEDPGFCGCNDNCYLNETCCLDYVKICTAGNSTEDVLHPEEIGTADEFEMTVRTNSFTEKVTELATTTASKHTTAEVTSESYIPFSHLSSRSSYSSTSSDFVTGTDIRTTSSIVTPFYSSQSQGTSTESFTNTSAILPVTRTKPKQTTIATPAQPTNSFSESTAMLPGTTESQTRPNTLKTTMEVTTGQSKPSSMAMPVTTTPTERSTLPETVKTTTLTRIISTTKVLTRPTVRQFTASTSVKTTASVTPKSTASATPKTTASSTTKNTPYTTAKPTSSTTEKAKAFTTEKATTYTTARTRTSTTEKATAYTTVRTRASTTPKTTASMTVRTKASTTPKATAFTTPKVTAPTTPKATTVRTKEPTAAGTTSTVSSMKTTKLKSSTLTTARTSTVVTETSTSIITPTAHPQETSISTTTKIITVASTSQQYPPTTEKTETVGSTFTLESSSLPPITSTAQSTSKWTTTTLRSTRPTPVPTSTSTRRYNLRPRTSTRGPLWYFKTISTIQSTSSTRRERNPSTFPMFTTPAIPVRDTTTRTTSTTMLPMSTPTFNDGTGSTMSKKVEVESQGHSRSLFEAEGQTSSSIAGIAVSVVLLSCLAGAILYVVTKRRRKKSKMSDDSEMRFLSDNEVLDYSDASVLDRILVN